MRRVALGRKNWLHVGSAQAGPKVAGILSVVESCRRIGAPVKEYLNSVLPGLDRRKLSEVLNLTPARSPLVRSPGLIPLGWSYAYGSANRMHRKALMSGIV